MASPMWTNVIGTDCILHIRISPIEPFRLFLFKRSLLKMYSVSLSCWTWNEKARYNGNRRQDVVSGEMIDIFSIEKHALLLHLIIYYRLFDSNLGKDVEFLVTTGKMLDSGGGGIFIVSVVTNSVPEQIEVINQKYRFSVRSPIHIGNFI